METPNGMEWPPLVLAVLLHLIVFGIAAWDVYCAFTSNGRYTVTAILQEWAYAAPMLPFMLGVAVGHLLWGRITTRGG